MAVWSRHPQSDVTVCRDASGGDETSAGMWLQIIGNHLFSAAVTSIQLPYCIFSKTSQKTASQVVPEI